jgi:hypothetical protein
MRDPAEIYTKRGTPLTIVVTRMLFGAYLATVIFAIEVLILPASTLSYVWLFYLAVIYYLAEQAYAFFLKKNIDLTFAFPLLFVIYLLNGVSMVFNAQDRIPILNRAEHFLSFVLLAYVIWVFFLKYLPQAVWRKHPYYTAILVFSVTSTFGVANEIAELLFDALFNTNLIGNQLDTSLDMLMNTLGAGLLLSTQLILGTVEEKPREP